MAAAKRHHTVPQFYLRGFANGDQIATVRLPGEARFTQSVRTAASQPDFYTVEGHEDGSDVFEKLLSTIEGEAASVFRIIRSGAWPLEAEDRMTLAHFVALQATRGPDQRRTLEHVAAKITQLEIEYRGRDRQPVLEGTNPGGPPSALSPIDHIRQMAESVDKLLPYIAGRPWSLVRFKRRSLLTSDAPVGLIPRPDVEPWEGTGFMTAWGITYPLTRKLGLLMSDPLPFADSVPVDRVRAGKLDHAESGTTRMEQFFNAATVNSASEWLYHHPEDARFVPDALPKPSPVTVRAFGEPDHDSGKLFALR